MWVRHPWIIHYRHGRLVPCVPYCSKKICKNILAGNSLWGSRTPQDLRSDGCPMPPQRSDEAFGTRSAPAGAECLVSDLTRHSATARPRRVPNASSRFYQPIPLPGSGQPPPDSIRIRGGGGRGVKSTPSLSLRILWVLVKYLTSKVGSSYLPEMFRKGKKYKRIPAPWASAPLSPPQNSGDLVRHSGHTPSWTQRQGAAKVGEKQRKSRKSPQWHPSQIPQIPKER